MPGNPLQKTQDDSSLSRLTRIGLHSNRWIQTGFATVVFSVNRQVGTGAWAWAGAWAGAWRRVVVAAAAAVVVLGGGVGFASRAQAADGHGRGYAQAPADGNTPAAVAGQALRPQFLAAKMVQDAKTALANQQYRSAWSLAMTVRRIDDPAFDNIRDQAGAVIDAINVEAGRVYDEAEKHWWYREYEEAEKQYRLMFEQFPHCDHFEDARNRLRAIRFIPGLAAKKLFAAAAAKESAKQYMDAAQRYQEVIAQFPETVAAIKARKALLSLSNDPDKRQAMSEEQQSGLVRELDLRLRLANNYLATAPQDPGDWVLYDRGVEYLHEIIAMAPDSPQAKQAHERIAKEEARIAAEEEARMAARKQAAAELAAAAEKARE